MIMTAPVWFPFMVGLQTKHAIQQAINRGLNTLFSGIYRVFCMIHLWKLLSWVCGMKNQDQKMSVLRPPKTRQVEL